MPLSVEMPAPVSTQICRAAVSQSGTAPVTLTVARGGPLQGPAGRADRQQDDDGRGVRGAEQRVDDVVLPRPHQDQRHQDGVGHQRDPLPRPAWRPAAGPGR